MPIMLTCHSGRALRDRGALLFFFLEVFLNLRELETNLNPKTDSEKNKTAIG